MARSVHFTTQSHTEVLYSPHVQTLMCKHKSQISPDAKYFHLFHKNTVGGESAIFGEPVIWTQKKNQVRKGKTVFLRKCNSDFSSSCRNLKLSSQKNSISIRLLFSFCFWVTGLIYTEINYKFTAGFSEHRV